MSNNVDRRIVEMKFDNKDFENNIQDSVESLDKLKKSLNLEESAKGLTALEKAGRKFSLDGIAEAAEAVTRKFSVLGTIGDQVLRRIGDAAFNALNKMKNFVDALTIQPISTGMMEYETQINAIQTILANTQDKLKKQGYSDAERLALVNDRLDQLNRYADKTIYNFTEMTRNIGTFTAAGVDLDVAVESIQGIANLAAVSGSTSEQASRAMYQLSQAISSGTVKLMDWNSVVNAGMGGEVFQKALLRTAKAMGNVSELGEEAQEAINAVEAGTTSFRDSLSSGWLTKDILTATLEQFSWDFQTLAEAEGKTVEEIKEAKKAFLLSKGYTEDDAEAIIDLAESATEAATKVKTFTQLLDTLKEAAQSGWTQTWEYIIGDFEEAKETLTGISDYFGEIIGKSADARNAIIKEWHDAGGRDMIWNKDPEKGPLGAFWNLVYGVKNLIDMIREEFQKIFPPATSQALLTFTQRIQQVTANFKAWTENSEGVEKVRRIISGIASAFEMAKGAIGYVWRGFGKLIGMGKPAAGGILEFAASIGDWLVKVKDFIKTSDIFQKYFSKFDSLIVTVKETVNGAIRTISDSIGRFREKIKNVDFINKIGQSIKSFVQSIPSAVAKVKDWANGLKEYIKTSKTLNKIWSGLKAFFEPILKIISDFGSRLKNAFSNFFNKDVSGEDSVLGKLKLRMKAFGEAFSGWFGDIKGSISTVWNKIKSFLTDFFTKTIPGFFNSKKIDASAILKKIKTIDWGTVLKSVLGVATFVEILKAVRNFSKIGKIADSFKRLTKAIKIIAKNGASLTKEGLFIKGRKPIADTLLKIAASIGILVASIYVLAKMDTADIMKGVGVITLLAAELLVLSVLFRKINLDGGSILKVSAAILLLVIPIKLLSSMKFSDALRGVFAIGLIFTELALFSRIIGNNFVGKKAGFIGLAIAINLMVIAIKSLAKLDIGSMAKSLIGMEFLLLEIAGFSKHASDKKIAGIIAMAIGINLMVTAVRRMGKLDTKTIIKGVLGLGGIMAAFGGMMKLAGGVKLGTSIALLLAMAGSLILFVEAFKYVQGMNMDDMVKFAASISTVMLSLSVALKVISTIPIVGALKGVASFAILIAGIGGILVGLGYLQSKWSGMTGFLESGGDVLGQIGTALGKFIGGIGNGIMVGLDLPEIGTELSNFMTNSSGFIDGAKTIDGSVLQGVEQLAAAILIIGGAEFINRLGSILTFTLESPVKRFADDIKQLGIGLSVFGLSILPLSIVPQAILDRSIGVATALAEVANKLRPTGFVTWLTGVGDMGKFGTDIGTLGTGLASFANEVSKIENFDQTKIDAVIATAEGLAAVESSLEAQGGIEDAIVGTQSLSKFGEGFIPFSRGLNRFITDIRQTIFDPETDSSKIDAVIKIAEALSALETGLEAQGGLEDALEGTKSLSAFSEGFVPFSRGLNRFITDIRQTIFDPETDGSKFDAVVKIAEALSALETGLEAHGGLEDAIEGTKSLSAFSEGFQPFGAGLNRFIIDIRQTIFDPETDSPKIDSVIAIAESLSRLETGLEAQGGLEDAIEGTKSLSKFSKGFQPFGEGLNNFITEVKKIEYDPDTDKTKLDAIVDVGRTLSQFEGTLNRQGGFDDWILGSKDLGTFGTNIRTLGESIGSYMSNITSVDTDIVAQTDEALRLIEDFAKGLEEGGIMTDQIETIMLITDDMKSFGISFAAFKDAVNNIGDTPANFETAKTVVGSFRDFINAFELEGKNKYKFTNTNNLLTIIEDFGTSLATFAMDITKTSDDLNAAANVINSIMFAVGTVSSIPDFSIEPIQQFLDSFAALTIPQFDEEGMASAQAFVVNLVEGIGGAEAFAAVITSIGNLSDAGSTAAEGTYSVWYSSGQYLAAGLGAGIESMAASVTASAVSVAAGAIQSIQMTWSVHSPSRVGEDLGMYFDLGIASGLESYSKVVSGKAADMGREVVESASTMLRGVDGSIFDNIDPNPTIRPVMDLTNIQNGVGVINDMFNSDRMIGQGLFRGMNFSRGVDALNLDGARILGSINNKDVVSELQSLSNRFDNLAEAVSNMQLVLDSGELVGRTSAMMDSSLGTLDMRRRRGN